MGGVGKSAAKVAEAVGVSERTVERSKPIAKQLERIIKFNERLGGKIRTGKLKVTKDDVIEIGKLNARERLSWRFRACPCRSFNGDGGILPTRTLR